MRTLLIVASLQFAASAANAWTRCPPGTYIARYSFGIWYCKQPTKARLACPPGRVLVRDHFHTPRCARQG